MRAIHGPGLGLGLAALLAAAAPAGAQVSSERAASLLVFPKIVYAGSRDTLVQIVNHANAPAWATCWYRNGVLTFPSLPPGPINPPLLTTATFHLALLAGQSTSFTAGRGRPLDPLDPPCDRDVADCYGAGADPGEVPAVAEPFTGELRCVQTDASGFALSGNHLSGEASIIDAVTGDAVRYAAIGIAGFDVNDGDDELRLGEEYAGCPEHLLIVHALEGGEASLGSDWQVEPELTLVTCSSGEGISGHATVFVEVTDELGLSLSAFTTLTGWRTLRFPEINPMFTAETLNGGQARTRLRVTAATSTGVLGVLEETHRHAGGARTGAATNLYSDGARTGLDLVVLP